MAANGGRNLLGWGLSCFLSGLTTAVIFSFVVYPRIASSTGAVLDPDGYGALGWGLWKLQTFSYYPSEFASQNRGPLYPMLVAALLHLSGGWWPYVVQLFQCMCVGLTCLLAYKIGTRLWDHRVGAITGMLCAVHPFLIWYSSRIWVESLAALLFTAIVAALLFVDATPTIYSAILVGLSVGAASLTKGTFLPFMIAVPAWMLLQRPRIRPQLSFVTLAISLAVIAPWTVRNLRLTGRFIPVHGHMGFNIHIGDSLSAHFMESPYALTPLWEQATKEAAALTGSELAASFDGWRAELAASDILLENSVEKYLSEPLFLPRKILINTVAFWAWSDTKPKTLVIAALQFPLLAAFLLIVIRLVRVKQFRRIQVAPVFLILLYYAGHLPVLAIGRYSVVLVPVMLAYCTALVFCRKNRPSTIAESNRESHRNSFVAAMDESCAATEG
jgi:4-amino-4-deoxy-L-arabinose transferase-like glycosyltransferase